MSKPFSIDSSDLKKIAKSFAFSCLAAAGIAASAYLDKANIPAQWVFLVPVAHSLVELVERFIKDNTAGN